MRCLSAAVVTPTRRWQHTATWRRRQLGKPSTFNLFLTADFAVFFFGVTLQVFSSQRRKSKERIAVQHQRYGKSHATCDPQLVLTCYPTAVAGTGFSDRGAMQGCVDLDYIHIPR